VSLRVLRRACGPLLAVIVTMTAGTAVEVALPTSALAADTASMESQFIADMNAARQSNGLAPYAVYSDLASIAREHSQNMAQKQELYHNPDLTTEVHGWQAVGENVGEGPSVSAIHNAFMQSPEHRANILDHDFTQVGVGVAVDKNGTIWVTEDFRQPESSSTGSSGGGTHSGSHGHHSGSASGSSTGSSSSGSAPATTPASAPTTSGAQSVAATPSRPHVSRSPRAVLMRRISELRAHPATTGDPVSQALAYSADLSRLAG
jgi:uncharacterized membrane protein YgcG